VGSIDCPHEIRPMPAAVDDHALEPRLFGHQLRGRDFAGATSQKIATDYSGDAGLKFLDTA
jgi:hypothetical protein